MLCAGGVDAAMGPRNKSVLGGAIQGIAGKDTWTCGGTWRHIFRTHRLSLGEITHRYARVLDVCATGKAGYFNRRAGWSVPELEPPCVLLIHNAHGNIGCQLRIYENHIAQSKARCFDHRFQTV